MVPQITATAAPVSKTGEIRAGTRDSSARMPAAASRTRRSGTHSSGAVARSRAVKATTRGAASSTAVRSAVCWWAVSSAS